MEIVEVFGFRARTKIKTPLFTMSVSAGKPIPVDNEIEKEIDLNEFLVERPRTTFFAKVKGEAMKKADIADGDILIIDASVEPSDGVVVAVSVNGALTIKIYREINGAAFLESQNGQFLPIFDMDSYIELKPIGVVTKVIHSL